MLSSRGTSSSTRIYYNSLQSLWSIKLKFCKKSKAHTSGTQSNPFNQPLLLIYFLHRLSEYLCIEKLYPICCVLFGQPKNREPLLKDNHLFEEIKIIRSNIPLMFFIILSYFLFQSFFAAISKPLSISPAQ